MKRRNALIVAMAAGLALAAGRAWAAPMTTAFTFQGELKSAGNLASGPVDFRFRIYDAVTGGTQIGGQASASGVSLTSGRFTLQLDFGVNIFQGERRFVEIEVANAGTGVFTILSPRQELTASPYAQFAQAAGTAALATNASALNGQSTAFYTNASNMSSGTLPSARLTGTYSGTLTLSSAANVFTGNGAALTNLSATNLATGTVADARLSGNVALRGNTNTFTAVNTFGAAAADATFVDGTGLVQVGANGAPNLGVAGNEIQARSAGAAAALLLNQSGGDVFADGAGTGRFAVGTTSPEARLHILDGSAGTVTANANSSAVFERSGANYLAILGPDAVEKGVSFGSPLNNVHGGIYYTNTGTMNFRTNGNQTHLALDQLGNLGINTPTPGATLDVHVPTGTVEARIMSDQNGGSAVLDLFENVSGGVGGQIAYDGSLANTLHLGTVNTAGGTRVDAITIARGSPDVSILGNLSVAGSFTIPSLASPLFINHATIDPMVVLQTAGTNVWTMRNLANGSGGDSLQIRNAANITKLEITQGATTTVTTNLSVLGSLTATTKSFKIDHPLDPEHKYLMHTCVESDEMVNVYSGNATTDARGYATITLPRWFDALNTDVRYQLTVVDDADSPEFVWAKVVERVKDNRFSIRTSAPDIEVSWQITGVRHDAVANHERTPVEIDKEPENIGRYIIPEAYGKPASARLLTPGEAATTHPPVEAAHTQAHDPVAHAD